MKLYVGGKVTLPDGYIGLDYIESNGTQYIDNIATASPTDTIEWETSVRWTQIADRMIMGAASGSGVLWGVRDGLYEYAGWPQSSIVPSTTDFDKVVCKYDPVTSTFELYVNDVFGGSKVITGFTETNSISLGHASNFGTSLASYAQFAYTKVKINGVLVCDMIPCINPNGEVGMYDLVTDTFRGNNGTGEFIAGNQIAMTKSIKSIVIPSRPLSGLPSGYTEVEYIETDGSAYIDTGLRITPSAHVKFDYSAVAENIPDGGFASIIGCEGTAPLSYIVWAFIHRTPKIGYAGGDTSGAIIVRYTTNFSSDGRHTLEMLDGVLLLDGTSIMQGTDNLNVDNTATANLCLFAREPNNYMMKAGGRIYGCQVNDVVSCNLVPCINPNGEVGMYDLVTDTFRGNNGTGEFIAGNPVETKIKAIRIGGV